MVCERENPATLEAAGPNETHLEGITTANHYHVERVDQSCSQVFLFEAPIGFVITHPGGCEAVGIAGNSLGRFRTEDNAGDAVVAAARPCNAC